MRIVFFGTSEFAVSSVRLLIERGMAPVAVVTAPDKLKGRGQQLTSSPIKKWCQANMPDVLVFQPEKLEIRNWKLEIPSADIYIVVSYGKIIPKEIYTIPRYGTLNIHPSLLPKYRGPSPIQATIFRGDSKTGVTIILIDEKIDNGPILAKREFPIPNKITYQELHDALAEIGAQLLVETLLKCVDGKITAIPQDETKATYTKLIKKEDGRIDWSKSAEEIERMVRAYNPWPGSFVEIKNQKSKIKNVLKIKKAEVIMPPISPTVALGTFFKIPDGFPAVVCGKGALKLLVVQPEGKMEMKGSEYLRGHKITATT